MADFAKTASAKAALQATGSDIHTPELFVLSLARGLDRVFKRDFETPKQGERYLATATTKRERQTFQTYRTLGGVVPQSRDADDINFVTRAEGFGFEVQTYNYRQGIQIEKTLEEVDDVGVIRGMQADLVENAKMTEEYAIADVFNRGVDPTNAPVLADDGMYLIDADRPNANPAAGMWSNEEADSAVTATSLWTARLNARKMTDENGRLYPTYIKKAIVRPDEEKVMEEIMKSEKNPANANNTYNTMYQKMEYEVYDYLTAANIFYVLDNPKSEKNELKLYWRVAPSLKTWVGDNPDVTKQRIRMAFGIGLGSPRKMWRGGKIV